MRLLLIPDATSPNGEDAFCREIAKRATDRGHETRTQVIPNGPLEATLDILSAAGFALNSDLVVINSLQPAALLAAKSAGNDEGDVFMQPRVVAQNLHTQFVPADAGQALTERRSDQHVHQDQ